MKYVCQVCGYIYDDDKEAVPFGELPDDWVCPLCKTSKANFKPQDIPDVTFMKEEVTYAPEGHVRELSYGQKAALFTNLARALEKQYHQEEANCCRDLAEYFTVHEEQLTYVTLDALLGIIREDVGSYQNAHQIAANSADRGADRALVWGEKVTRMLLDLLSRYQAAGEQMLADTRIWVCSACGFVSIGDNPPEVCPVCRVPAFRFEEVV